MSFEYKLATINDLEYLWNKNIAKHHGDSRWINWKTEFINYNSTNMAHTFVITNKGVPIGEGTLLLSQNCSAINGRLNLANNKNIGNVNALRISKKFEGNGHISKLMKCLENYALQKGVKELTIGVEAAETRNLAIYLHWGYNIFVMSEIEDGELVLYYKKIL